MKNLLTIYSKQGSDIYDIENYLPFAVNAVFVNSVGEQVLETVLNPGMNSLNLSAFPIGVYYIKYSDGKTTYTTQLLIHWK